MYFCLMMLNTNTQMWYILNILIKVIAFMFNHVNLKIITTGLFYKLCINDKHVLVYLHRFFFNLYSYYRSIMLRDVLQGHLKNIFIIYICT